MSFAQGFPLEWWKEVPRSEAASWEILPQDAAPGEVILSKRTELGVFSNFAATQIHLEGKTFASIEGLWQSLKYPDPLNTLDPRHDVSDWPFTRSQVEMMTGPEAKAAGDVTKKIYSRHNWKFVSWMGFLFDYLDQAEGSHYHYLLIEKASRAKLDQHPELWSLLLKTDCLKLKPDHKASANETAAYRYYEIYMKLRDEKRAEPCRTIEQ